jgi:hypothetical protein
MDPATIAPWSSAWLWSLPLLVVTVDGSSGSSYTASRRWGKNRSPSPLTPSMQAGGSILREKFSYTTGYASLVEGETGLLAALSPPQKKKILV